MNINPMELLQMKGELDGFNARHPKLRSFFADVAGRVDTGSVLELSVTDPQGNKVRTNIRVTQEDTELLQKLSSLIKKQ